MKFKMVHNNLNVFNLERSLEFYDKALGLREKRRITPADGSFIIVYLGNDQSDYELELSWLRDWEKPYDLGDNEFHLAFTTENYEEAFKKHSDMGCVCFVNEAMGIYFIEDPDGYWLEVLPARK
ncbi:MAG: lactoylglutathione lyase [Clostridiales bacterium]|jgi:lactoylglutathione lyase|nr:lactoylglutathione lyase [Clostridiales bacterium]